MNHLHPVQWTNIQKEEYEMHKELHSICVYNRIKGIFSFLEKRKKKTLSIAKKPKQNKVTVSSGDYVWPS